MKFKFVGFVLLILVSTVVSVRTYAVTSIDKSPSGLSSLQRCEVAFAKCSDSSAGAEVCQNKKKSCEDLAARFAPFEKSATSK